MSRTNKTKPLKFRKHDAGFTWRTTTNLETLVGVGRGGTKLLKRQSHKRNRRRDTPNERIGPHGYGSDNYKYAHSD